jgi:ABC-type transport system involved in cytochrome c biogenesis permease component
MRLLRDTLTICAVELRVEHRSGQVLITMVLLAALCCLCFAFAGRASEDVAVPALWISLALAATAGTVQRIGRQERDEVLPALLAGPLARAALYLGRVLAFTILLGVTALGCVGLCLLFFGPALPDDVTRLGLLTLLATLGLAALGMAVALGVSGTRTTGGRVASLALLPLSAPLILAGAGGTRALLQPAPTATWPLLLLIQDGLLLLVGTLLIGRTVER